MNSNEEKNSVSRKTLSSPFMNLLISFSVVLLTVIIDQITKILAVKYLKPVYDHPLWPNVLHLTYVENRGAAFGMLKDNRWVFMIASSVAVILMIALLVFYRKKINIFVSVSLALVIGGGIGNMIDRVAYGYVVDFINFELIDFAVFNAADSFVCVGVFLIFIYILFIDDGGLLSNLKRKPAVQVDDMTANVEGSKISHGADVSINKDGMRHECAESDCLSDSRKDNRVNKVQHHGSRALRNMRKSVLSSETDGSVDRDDY